MSADPYRAISIDCQHGEQPLSARSGCYGKAAPDKRGVYAAASRSAPQGGYDPATGDDVSHAALFLNPLTECGMLGHSRIPLSGLCPRKTGNGPSGLLLSLPNRALLRANPHCLNVDEFANAIIA